MDDWEDFEFQDSEYSADELVEYGGEKMIIEMKKGSEATNDHEHNSGVLKEVIIYESGNPVLKVESGTTLKVIKLLYEAEHNKQGQILGVRPKQFAEGIPCIVTLDESKLNESSYDILVSDENNQEKQSPTTPNVDELTTSRCIDCSRESWKTKRFTNVGMNTEISINPNTELDVGKISTNTQQQQQQQQAVTISGQSMAEKQRHKSVPHSSSTFTQSSSIRPMMYKGMSQSEYMVPLSSGIHNGKPHPAEEVEIERPANRSPASPTYGLDVYGGAGGIPSSSQIRYPVQPNLEQMHYEHFIPSHSWSIERSRYAHSRSPHREHISSRTPPHRNRSPLSPRTSDIRDQYSPHYHDKHHPAAHHLPAHYEQHRSHRDERSAPVPPHYEHREDSLVVHKKRGGDPMYIRKDYPRELPPTQAAADFHQSEKQKRLQPQPAEEPPVFVLPNDFDAVSGLDPRLAGMQDRRPAIKSSSPPVYHERNDKEQERSKSADAIVQPSVIVKEEYQNSPNNSTSSFSPKSGGEGGDSPDSSTNNTNSTQKLFCKICNSVFPTKSLLYKHLRGHTSDEKPFKCNECGQGFTLSSNLRQHRIIHRGYKPFQCEFCGKKFMRSNVYKQHRRIHTGEEMHKCGLCPSEFLQKYALMKHMKKNHDIDTIDG